MFFYTHGLFCTHDQLKCTVLSNAKLRKNAEQDHMLEKMYYILWLRTSIRSYVTGIVQVDNRGQTDIVTLPGPSTTRDNMIGTNHKQVVDYFPHQYIQ